MDCSQVQFCDRKTQIDLQQLQELFQLSAFWARDRKVEDLAIAIKHSDPVISAWDGDRLIGFARATSDGIYRATIWDVVVHPDYQGAGLGRKLVQTVLSHPQVSNVERLYLMTTNQQEFYKRIGFEVNQTTTMVYFNQPLSLPSSAISVEVECDIG
ncbi:MULTISPECIES: GNAT family N-acetyltransferase [Leptolyngbya]|jgi:ribosomal protein S18 acetylase RimI-like enzyme|uniref:N-acetylglutamate synthase family acetyltransferase n=2 Tax=Leptolyngbya boryana TaxID=1184 RepID=A0A1Z4JPU2_LEPBY|nr:MULTISPECIES: GNAT family N-acetyltransferase [Leptolyngbya]BAY58730.1 N-acetylglutamate synthase family acetyltransferase [Leptolyngbya boryana NIES-2135]MBD1859364.1 GNAT family N-acetyltransferase [Leptolyngbya sp. FACHB-1624]MBD2370193.1 GNAT family N-acetyltransferase [Leptolyngbya sp. FACHB-161]MBD2376539.1 GNAT family N-acetyltransferase [Leptolyngbya sp. FACHB-238]MBD2400811.1 GNAT family N-acetyltransferase [Leptolyngbya sp. FACHB-239]